MKAWLRRLVFFLPVFLTVILSAQPERAAKDALEHLEQAGSYSWSVDRKFDVGGSAAPSAVWRGMTDLRGVTLIDRHNLRMAIMGEQAAYELKSGWRHCQDLSDDERKEIKRRLPPLGPDPRSPSLVLPHVLLAILMGVGEAFHEDGPDIVATLDLPIAEFDSLVGGQTPRSSLGAPLARKLGLGREKYPELKGVLRIRVGPSNLELFSVEYPGLHPKIPASRRVGGQSYTVEFSKVGSTNVELEPEVQALFAPGH